MHFLDLLHLNVVLVVPNVAICATDAKGLDVPTINISLGKDSKLVVRYIKLQVG